MDTTSGPQAEKYGSPIQRYPRNHNKQHNAQENRSWGTVDVGSEDVLVREARLLVLAPLCRQKGFPAESSLVGVFVPYFR